MALTPRLKSLSDRAVDRLLKTGVALLAVLVLTFGVVYYLGQRTPSGPSLADRTISATEAAVRAQPNDIAARLKLAAAYQVAHRQSDALVQYDEILEVLPDDHTTLLARGDLLAAEGDPTAAMADYQRVIDTAKGGEFAGADPQLARAYLSLGTIQLEQDSADLAVASLEAALRIDGADADALYQLGVAELELGNAKRAVASVRKALQFVPTGWCEPYATLGDAYRALTQAPQAEYAGAMAAFCNNDSAGATERLTGLLDGPEAVDAMLGLGMIAERAGERDQAIRWYSKVLAADPKNISAAYALSGMGAKASNPTGASPARTPRSTSGEGRG